MTKEDLSKLIDECCDDIFDRKEPLVNVKARLYYVLKKQLTLTDVVKSLPIERPKLTTSYNELIQKKCFWCGNSK
tara:strand:- start:54 stop:278 length:225 start_codon:yes stop_codon:yes gene_type:complete